MKLLALFHRFIKWRPKRYGPTERFVGEEHVVIAQPSRRTSRDPAHLEQSWTRPRRLTFDQVHQYSGLAVAARPLDAGVQLTGGSWTIDSRSTQ